MLIDATTILTFTFALTLMMLLVTFSFTYAVIELKKRIVRDHWNRGMLNEYERYLAELSGVLHNKVQQQLAYIRNLATFRDLKNETGMNIQKSQLIEAIDEVNLTIGRINKSMNLDFLRSQSLIRLIEAELKEAKSKSAITEYHIDWLHESDMNFKTKLLLYRIAQEAIGNIVEHALASSISVSIKKHRKKLILKIEDDGLGIDEEEIYSSPKHGLANMRQRAATLNADLSIHSIRDEGTTIKLEMRLPL
ncbi:sensor histidine kinase [uncultured Pedobacter sp.]|uniref:sensor histidine kinase n=1 Tax=uncultured Pedobacter sp. TaxID=246139 RepID=UPI002621C34F|nr:sensor histidine kinase [uncultured Pedobacter sp.]